MIIERQNHILDIESINNKIKVKVPDNISIHQFVLCLFILLFIIKLRNPNYCTQVLERILNHEFNKNR